MKTFFSFTPEFIDKVIQFANDNDLEICTTERQSKNGTVRLYDHQTGTFYTMHKNGYVRRYYFKNSWHSGYITYSYFINPREVKFVHTTRGSYTYRDKVMVNPEKQLEILKKCVPSYRTRDWVQKRFNG